MLVKTTFVGVALLVVIVTGRPAEEASNGAKDDLVPITLEEFLSGYYSATGFNGSWASRNEIMYRDPDTYDVVKFNVETFTTSFYLNYSVLQQWSASSYSVSPDGAHILIGHSTVTGFRHSTYRKYVVYDIDNEDFTEIANGETIPLATWSPVGGALAYVLENDVYHATISSGSITERRLTYDGVTDVVYNGVPDWVYEEEVFGSGSGLWFSPDGTKLVIASFNDTEVKKAEYYYYGEPGDLEYQYPTQVTIKYPKVGNTNPEVSLSLIDLSNTSASWIDLSAPEDIVGEDHIIFTVNWLNNDIVAAIWTNRVQNIGQIVGYDAVTGEGSYLLTLREDEGWLQVPTPAYYDGYVVFPKSQPSGTDAGDYLHLTRFDYANNILSGEVDLSPGQIAVISVIGYDSITGRIYYTATGDAAPAQRHLYSVPLDGSASPTCISCSLITPEGNNCTYAAASFSSDKSYYILQCTGPDPSTTRIYDSNHNQIYSWQENESLREKISLKSQPVKKYLDVTVNGFTCKVKLELPPQLDESDVDTKYPMLVYVYAGPNTIRITDAASYGWGAYLASNRSVIHAQIDGRGSGYKGHNMLHQIYRNLGTVEIQDQIDVTALLQSTYGWIDPDRTAIWGWSYGGYATTMVLATDTKPVFSCGIAVAPVSSWIYYDTIYTERYMGLPTEEDNLAAYNASDATRLVEGIRGKKYLLIHGTADDNVHYHNAMALTYALAAANIQFEEISYTDEAHGLTSVYPHLYHSMDKFWQKCLDLDKIY